jgi:pimeloyl-ACP methyl ester carboxylesterase
MDESAYRVAENKVWASLGCKPSERRINLACSQSSVRVQSIGAGPPVVLIHGTPNAGTTWAPLIPHLAGFSCHLVDRPGTGLSQDYRHQGALAPFADRFVAELLDGLQIEQAPVIASSYGGLLALRSCAATPRRVARLVLMGCPALAPGMQLPAFMRAMRVKVLRWLIPRLPPSARQNDDILRQLGHGASLDAHRIAPGFQEWYLDLLRHTRTMANDIHTIGHLLQVERLEPQLTLTDSLLAQIQMPTLVIWGEDDGFGGTSVAQELTRRIPQGELHMVPAAGHLPWLDQPAEIGADITRFLQRP